MSDLFNGVVAYDAIDENQVIGFTGQVDRGILIGALIAEERAVSELHIGALPGTDGSIDSAVVDDHTVREVKRAGAAVNGAALGLTAVAYEAAMRGGHRTRTTVYPPGIVGAVIAKNQASPQGRVAPRIADQAGAVIVSKETVLHV